MGPVGPRWDPCWPHEPCYQCSHMFMLWFPSTCCQQGMLPYVALNNVEYRMWGNNRAITGREWEWGRSTVHQFHLWWLCCRHWCLLSRWPLLLRKLHVGASHDYVLHTSSILFCCTLLCLVCLFFHIFVGEFTCITAYSNVMENLFVFFK